MHTVAITGGSGLVGSRIIELLGKRFKFVDLAQKVMDVTDKKSVEEAVGSHDFDTFLHLAGYTLVDRAETQKDMAEKINVEGTRNVFTAAHEKRKNFIYISTDFVFDGKNPPYDEESVPHPLGTYAMTKYKGEQIVGNQGMIVRISYPYRAAFEPKRDFVRSLKHLLQEKKQLRMISDAVITPTFIDDIALGLGYLIEHFDPSVYHLVGGSSLSPYNAALKIAETFNLDTSLISPISFKEYSLGKAPRSQYSAIKSKKNTFQTMKTFEEGLHEMRSQLGQDAGQEKA